MKSKNIFLFSVVTALAVVLASFTPQPVVAKSAAFETLPAYGGWMASEDDVIEDIIPQFLLEAELGDYALLQSDGVIIVGRARICHPYRGGQFGWSSEIRRATPAGWVPVPTTNGWEPDEEGQYMTCANVGSGTYAVFGYWDKPAGWNLAQCPPEGFGDYYMDVTEFMYLDIVIVVFSLESFDQPNQFIYGERCGDNGTIILENGLELDYTFLAYCCNGALYKNLDFPGF